MKPFALGLLLLATTLALAAPAAQALIFVVDDPADPLPVTGTMTLRQAILAANGLPGPHNIVFQIPAPGVVTIFPTSELPPVTVGNVIIDGFTQPGASPGASPPSSAVLLIELDGSMAGYAHGLILQSPLNTVQGLVVKNFEKDGIRIEGMPSPPTQGNLIFCNFVGTDVSGTIPMGNCRNPQGGIWAGVDILCTPGATLKYCTANVVDRNLISGNQRCGVQISSCPPSDCGTNTVTSNYVGTDLGGMLPLGNLGTGVVLAEGTHHNQIGGNVISGNGANGVDITGNYFTQPPVSTDFNQFTNNLIGVAVDGVTATGNGARGVSVGIFELNSYYGGFCSFNTFTTNTVAYNGLAGISAWEHPSTAINCDQNAFVQNAVYNNQAIGIDLGDNGVTVNDPGDADTGADQELNFPIITGAVWAAGTTTVSGTAAAGIQVELYRANIDPSGYGEGDLYLGTTTANAIGIWTLPVGGLVVGNSVTAIGQDWIGGSTTNTSEFSPVVAVTGQATNPCANAYEDFGDAPEGVTAYPNGMAGAFPTCLAGNTVGNQIVQCGAPVSPPPLVTGYVRHLAPAGDPSKFWLGCGTLPNPGGIDSEIDGKMNQAPAGTPSACNQALMPDCVETVWGGMTFGQDECFGDLDAGVPPPALSFGQCTVNQFSYAAASCATAPQTAYLNLLIDLDQDGDWNDLVLCPTIRTCADEWAVQNAAVQLMPGCNVYLTPPIQVGPNTGPAWMRITLSEQPAPADFPWNGTVSLPGGRFVRGETEDYPVDLVPSLIGVPGTGAAPELRFGPALPNPARDYTTLRYALPAAGVVRIAVYDVAGRQVRELVSEALPAGEHGVSWDYRDGGGVRVPAGVYLARLEFAGRVLTRQLVRLK